MTMSSSRNRITDTGWRLVGKATELVPETRAVHSVTEQDCVFAARFSLKSWLGRTDPLSRALEIVGNAVASEWRDAPPLAFDRPAFRPAGRFEGLSWEVDGERTAWMGELWWRHPHPVVRRVPCSTHLVIEELGQHVQLTVRVYADGGVDALGGLVGAGQARPAWLSTLAHECRLTSKWGDTTPVRLTGPQMDAFVRDVLFDDRRDWPMVVLSAMEHGGYAVPPEQAVDLLLGLARVYYLDEHATSYRLTDLLGGKQLSCFWGAMRVYLPRFSCADDGSDHPLLFPDELLDPASCAELAGELAVGMQAAVPIADGIAARKARSARPRGVTPPMGTAVVMPTAVNIAEDASASRVRAAAVLPSTPTVVSTNGSHDGAGAFPGAHELAAAIGAITDQLGALTGAITKLAAANRELFDEVAQLRTGNAVRLASIASIERRIERIDSFVLNEVPGLFTKPAAKDVPETPSEIENRTELVDIVRQISARHADALLVLESAERSAIDSPYEDVDRVAKVLDAMAEIARRRQIATLGMPVRQAFREYGIDYRSSVSETTPGKQRSQYLLSDDRGHLFECLEHVILGSTYDPRYCLRIYFTSRAVSETRFVIGHVGRHFDVITST